MSFEEQKQEIIEHLEIISNACCDISEIIDLVQQLTQPKPPTCASCKYLNANTCVSECMNTKIPISLQNDEGIPGNFGCNKHSDYERKE